jgi:para-nitrobenzyl esterase
VFNNLSARTSPSELADQRLTDMMSSYWANFAATGNPNGKGLPQWPVYRQAKDTAIEFGDEVKPIANLHKPALDAIDDYYAAERAKK